MSLEGRRRIEVPIRDYVKALDRMASEALAQTSVDQIAAWLAGKTERLAGVPTPAELSAARAQRGGVRNQLGERFAQRVRDRLRERQLREATASSGAYKAKAP